MAITTKEYLMSKNIILVNYNKCDKDLYSKLSALKKYNLTIVYDYKAFTNAYDNTSYDLCLVNIKDKNEHNFVVYYMSHQKKNQKILSLKKSMKKCFFNNECSLCNNYKVKVLPAHSNSQYLQSCIDDFDLYKCKVCER